MAQTCEELQKRLDNGINDNKLYLYFLHKDDLKTCSSSFANIKDILNKSVDSSFLNLLFTDCRMDNKFCENAKQLLADKEYLGKLNIMTVPLPSALTN